LILNDDLRATFASAGTGSRPRARAGPTSSAGAGSRPRARTSSSPFATTSSGACSIARAGARARAGPTISSGACSTSRTSSVARARPGTSSTTSPVSRHLSGTRPLADDFYVNRLASTGFLANTGSAADNLYVNGFASTGSATRDLYPNSFTRAVTCNASAASTGSSGNPLTSSAAAGFCPASSAAALCAPNLYNGAKFRCSSATR
jgi:hypothetical protein